MGEEFEIFSLQSNELINYVSKKYFAKEASIRRATEDFITSSDMEFYKNDIYMNCQVVGTMNGCFWRL